MKNVFSSIGGKRPVTLVFSSSQRQSPVVPRERRGHNRGMPARLSLLVLLFSIASVVGRGAEPTAALDVDALIERAELRMDAGDAVGAYELLAAERARLAGQMRFDYILGLAAIESDRAAEALAPLRRVIAARPDFFAARLELAAALNSLGDSEAARAEYDALLALDPPDYVRSVIGQRISRMPLTPRRLAAKFTAESMAGYDSNANGSTTDDAFQGILLDPRQQATASGFLQFGAAAEQPWQLTANTRLSARAAVSHRANPDADFVDQTITLAQLSLTSRFAGAEWSATVDNFMSWLDGERFRSSSGLELGLALPRWRNWELAGVVRGSVLTYEPLPLRWLDVDRVFGGVALSRHEIGTHRLRVGGALLGGQDRARNAGSPYSNDRYGGRLFADAAVTSRITVSAEVAYLVSDFFDGGGFFGIDRLDRLKAAALAVQWRDVPARGWIIGPQVVFTENESNASLFRYQRVETALYARYEFR